MMTQRWAMVLSACVLVVSCRSSRPQAVTPATAPAPLALAAPTAAPPPDAAPQPTSAPVVARELTRVDTPFAIARSCTDMKSGASPVMSLDAMPVKLRTPKKIAPTSRGYRFSADGTHVMYVDANGTWLSVSLDGGPASPATTAEMTALDKPPAFADLVRAYQFSTHGDVTPLSMRYLAIGLTKHGAETERLFIADLDAGQLVPVAADGLFTIWGAERVDDHRVAFIGRDHHMYVADAAARTLSCASVTEKGDIQGFYRAGPDVLLFLAGHDIHIADLAAGIDHTLAKLPADAATVVFASVPGKPARYVVHVEQRGKDERQLFLQIDATARTITRITDPIAGWSNLVVSPTHVLFASGFPTDPDARPPKPPRREPTQMPGRPQPICDPARDCRACGWQSDGCYDYVWCGACPGAAPPPPPPPTDGIYTFAL